MPCFGPCWVHLYGSTRDYSFFNENNELNNGIVSFVLFWEQFFLFDNRSILVDKRDPLEPAAELNNGFSPGSLVKCLNYLLMR